MSTVSQQEAQAPLVLTLDVGSSSVRASLYDQAAYAVEGLEVRNKYQFESTADGGVQKDADELLVQVATAIDQLLANAGKLRTKIDAVAIDTFWHSLIGVDAKGQAITPVYSWADTRSSHAAAQLQHELDPQAVHNRTGCIIHPSYFPAKLRWLATTQADTYKKVKTWMSFGEYFYLKLFGQTVISLSMASGTGLFDQFEKKWDVELLQHLQVSPDQFSTLTDLAQPLQGLQTEYAHRWPQLKTVKWYLAVGDGASGNLGGGCFSPERLAIMVGTSGAMRVCVKADKLPIPAGLFCYRADGSRLIMGGSLSEGGNVFAWLRQTLQLPNLFSEEAELQKMQPDGHGLTILPFVAGERAPGWAGNARFAINGISLNTSPVEIVRAALESIAYRFGLIHELLQPAVPKASEIIASGAALLNSPAWLQIMADVLNRPVKASGENETSSRGAALLVLEQMGAFGDKGLEAAHYEFDTSYQPDPARHERYAAAIERQRELYNLLVKPEV